MPYRFEDRKKMAEVRTPGLWAHVCWFLGAVFAIIGIIAAAIDASIGLGATNWLLLAIVAALLSIPFFLGMIFAWYLREKK
jgi:hypothetical protein